MKLCPVTFALLLVATSCAAFAPASSCTSRTIRLVGGAHSLLTTRHLSSNKGDDDDEIVPSLDNSVIPPPSVPQPKRLDPLVQSLTRMDVDTANAETIQVPILGELILDRSLYLLVPAAAFAVLGFIFSIYVAVTATDDWVVKSEPPITQPAVVTGSECRGLCSSSEQDLEGLRNFMNKLGK